MGSPSDQQKKQKGQQKPEDAAGEARDTRMKPGGKKPGGKRNEQQGQPKGGQKSPIDPATGLPRKGSAAEDATGKPPHRKDDIAGWRAALPPEIRDAIDAGRSEDIPDRYKSLVRRYNLWLQKHRGTRK